MADAGAEAAPHAKAHRCVHVDHTCHEAPGSLRKPAQHEQRQRQAAGSEMKHSTSQHSTCLHLLLVSAQLHPSAISSA